MKNPYRVAYRDNVTHSPNKMRISASDTYKLYYLNESGGECRFNAYNGAVVCCPSENKFVVIEIPEIDLSIM